MHEMMVFISSHGLFSIAITFLNLITCSLLIKTVSIRIDRHVVEAAGGRNENSSIYARCVSGVRKSVKICTGRYAKSGLFVRARDRMLKAGYTGENAAGMYIACRYIAPVLLFIIVSAINFPVFKYSFIAPLAVCIIVEYVVFRRKRQLEMKFNRYVYKIYKYLHNQINSGVRPTDAIKTVYLVIEDRELREILTRLAARYELTLNIDESLGEFQSHFDVPEAETLCVALKQGIQTGDNTELLSRQEQFMFSKYFNYIQAETDSCRLRGTVSVLVFAMIIVVMIAVPLINDVVDAAGRIFVN